MATATGSLPRILVSVLILGLCCTAPVRAGVCGDGVRDEGEACDDGNVLEGDGCGPTCEVENLPPDCSGAVASPVDVWPPNHAMVPVAIEGVVDPDGDEVTLVVKAVAQDEPVDGTGNGATCPDAEGVGSSTVSVRAERSGQGDGRVYHVTFEADDGRGGCCTGTVTTCVRHDRRPGGECVDQGPLYDSIVGDVETCGACQGDDCVPSDDDFAACGADLPQALVRRIARARVLLARAAEAGNAKRAAKLGRRAARLLERAAGRARVVLDRDCGDGVAAMLESAATCASCPVAGNG